MSRRSGRIPGLVALVSRDGHTHVEAVGTAAATVLLDEYRLRLDDPQQRPARRARRQDLGPVARTPVPTCRPTFAQDSTAAEAPGPTSRVTGGLLTTASQVGQIGPVDQPLLQSEPIDRGTVVDALVARVRADILSGRYPAGSLLPPERALAASYGVTRTSLKHALVRLVQAGLLATKHGVGTRVLDHARLRSLELLPELVMADGPGWFVEIFETRREIGALVVARAAERAEEEHHTRLTDLVDRVRTAAGPDEAQVAECEIHRVFGEACGNRVYRILVDTLLDAYMPVRALFVQPFVDPPVAAARIRSVVEAVIMRDPIEAHSAATAYLAETERLMLGQE